MSCSSGNDENIVLPPDHPTKTNPKIPKFGEWGSEEEAPYTVVTSDNTRKVKTTPNEPQMNRDAGPSQQSKVLKFGSTTTDVPKLGKWEVEEVPYTDQRYDYRREAMSIPNEPQMNCDAGTSQVAKLIPPHVAMTREVSKSKRADDGCSISSADFDTNPDAIKSGGGVLIERSPLHRRMGGRGSGCQTSSFDGSTVRPAQSWARSGTRNIGYIAMDKLKRVCHAVSYKKNIGVLQTKIQVLMEEIAEVQSVLMSEENYSMDGVQHWLSQADEILKEANGIVEGRNNMADKKRMCSPCWDPTSSWETGEMLMHIDNILEVRKGLDLSSYFCGLSYCKKLQSRESILQQILEDLMGTHINVIGIYGMIGVGKTVLSKELAKRVRNNKLYDDIVMVLVSEPLDVKLIQAQIANKIGLQLSEADDEETRAHILYNKLDKKVMECGEETITEPIQQAKILVILDGIWSVSDLRKVGIPYKQEGKSRCKVVLISRNADVCREMGAEKNFLVECLNVDEAKILFQESLKDKIESMEVTLEPERYEYVENVILTKCGGLPLMINSLACTLRSMSQSNWEVLADQMESQSLLEVDEVKEVPCAILELCNNFIQNGGKQKLFLLICCLIQQGDMPLEKLMRYGIGFGLVDQVGSVNSIVEPINSWVHELKCLSVLMESKKLWHVNMHDLIQDVAVSALSQGDCSLLEPRLEAGTVWHTRESYENCVAISTMPDSNCKCLNGLELPKLEAFLLKGGEQTSSLPDNFFQGMQNLKILDISGIRDQLPSSIRDLKNLVTLHLEDCEIRGRVLSIICNNLARLEVLSLRGSNIETLPDEIGNLTNLRVLDLNAHWVCKFPVDAVAKLDQLRELYLLGNEGQWSTNDVEKLAQLRLEVFEIYIHAHGTIRVCDAPNFPNVGRFRIIYSTDYTLFRERHSALDQDIYSYSRVLLIDRGYRGNDHSDFEESGLKALFLRAEFIKIIGVHGLCKGIPDWNIHGFSQLKNLSVDFCKGMECMLDATSNASIIQQRQIFPELQVLSMRNLPSLTSLCSQTAHRILFNDKIKFPSLKRMNLERLDRIERLWDSFGSEGRSSCFGNLKCMTVSYCRNLESLFPPQIVNILVQLEQLKVESCGNMKEVIASDVEDDANAQTMITFPKLQTLTLGSMGKLQCFYRGPLMLNFPMLRELYLFRLKEMQTFTLPQRFQSLPIKDTIFFDGEINFGSLEHLRISEMDIELLERHSETTIFPNLSRLALLDLPNMKALPNINSKALRFLDLDRIDCFKVLSSIQPTYKPSMSLVLSWKLEGLRLSGYESVEELFDYEKATDHNPHQTVKLFSALRELELRVLRQLKTIPWSMLRNLRSLILYSIHGCTSLISTTLLVGSSVLPLLEYMKIEYSNSLEAVISKEVQEDEVFVKYGMTIFPSLRRIDLDTLLKFESFSMGSYEAHFPSLETVVISGCGNMKSFSLGALRTPRLKHLVLNSTTTEANESDDLNYVLAEAEAEAEARRAVLEERKAAAARRAALEVEIHERRAALLRAEEEAWRKVETEPWEASKEKGLVVEAWRAAAEARRAALRVEIYEVRAEEESWREVEEEAWREVETGPWEEEKGLVVEAWRAAAAEARRAAREVENQDRIAKEQLRLYDKF